MSLTIQETISQLHSSLNDYIEATYHISAPSLIAQRQELLARPGVIAQIPYLESTPRYETGPRFADMQGLHPAALSTYSLLSQKTEAGARLIYDPPYKHQSESIRRSLIEGKNLVIMTGTGSGKTESFLLPVLGKLAREAATNANGFRERPAIRALVLYPMNALVNDQLGRLRSIFGDARLVDQFKAWAGRPARFARYTSRTPYAGVRSSKKDSTKLRAFDTFYVDILRRIASDDPEDSAKAQQLLRALKERGKWPAKPDLEAWFGDKGEHWQDSKGNFQRAITLIDDSELVTRHEVQDAPPDLLVTNYSMLEYMLMRPIERSIFDKTRAWLTANPNEKFLVILDEAHLYRGAAGAEVGLLLRRLRDRIGAPLDRFQVICATASFKDAAYAPHFGAQLSGIPAETFVPITGSHDLRSHSSAGSKRDAEILAGVSLDAFYDAQDNAQRLAAVKSLLDYRHVTGDLPAETALHQALAEYGPMGLLINATMKEALPISELGAKLFPSVDPHLADNAVTTLMALGSIARTDPKAAGLLPCRIHNFFRGLPGLWVCMDPACTEIGHEHREGICGKLYSQPQRECGCGARVLEFYTCRNCGTAYARAYTDDVDVPSLLWAEPGQRLRMAGGETSPLLPIDLLLQSPSNEKLGEPADYDLETGRLNPANAGPRMRRVYLPASRLSHGADDEDENSPKDMQDRGKFIPCGVCEKRAGFNRSYVQDHQTKGDQPFLALVARQIQIQPPGAVQASHFAPLQGRKVLAFSDSRQVAARLAPNLQMYSVRDSLRPIIVYGYKKLLRAQTLRPVLSLDDLYLAVALASKELGVRLRPELKQGETFDVDRIIDDAIAGGRTSTDMGLAGLCMEFRPKRPPEALLDSIITTIQDRFWGFESLALADLVECRKNAAAIENLPSIPTIAETGPHKRALVRAWLRCWHKKGFWLDAMPTGWTTTRSSEGTLISSQRGKFKAMDTVLSDKAARKIFNDKWSPELLRIFTQNLGNGHNRLKGSELSLGFDGDWVRCTACKSIYRPVPTIKHCLDCGAHAVEQLDPDHDKVFGARKGFYRKPVIEALATPPRKPMALIAAEHTAQLNAPQNEDVFSKAEENELLFQDIALLDDRLTAIDILSSTTTMEVGIDLGALSGVALRNMPPGRANYQQRAGRAGRRGNAVATVVAFGSADSHDEHYFSAPDGMIRGDVVDPTLTLDNRDIVSRHIRAFLLQNYHQDRLPVVDPDQRHDLFSVLGNVSDFRNGTGILNRADFAQWLAANEATLRQRVESWMPSELSVDDRKTLLEAMVADCLEAIDDAIRPEAGDEDNSDGDDDQGGEVDGGDEDCEEAGEERPRRASTPNKLLDRLLYCGKLPRYAFPTDVATFHVFDLDRSTKFRPIMRFAPSQGLPIALSQYAPDKQVWISGKCYTSGAIYSVMSDDRFNAWQSKRLYMECRDCGYARTFDVTEVARGDTSDCRACGGLGSFGPARYWFRPPGFAHPVDVEEVTSPDDVPETSYATRAKLTMGTPAESADWEPINDRVRGLDSRQHLLVSNTGPNKDGYTYCVKCGRIEASSSPTPTLLGPHRKPFPADANDQACDGIGPTRHLVLGTDFITDIALFSMRVEAPLKLQPAHFSTQVALRTVSEALAKAACQILEIEPGELMAEFRPALTPGGTSGLEAEIFVYDTLPGGAGFSSQLPARGLELYQRALQVMKTCPEDCDASCYRCLRSFKNKFEHTLLDRHVGAELLEYLLNGVQPDFNARRLTSSTDLLCNDLKRQAGSEVAFEPNATVQLDGKAITVPILASRGGTQYVIALSGPLTNDHPADPIIRGLRESGSALTVIVENELLVRANLPAATRNVLSKLGT